MFYTLHNSCTGYCLFTFIAVILQILSNGKVYTTSIRNRRQPANISSSRLTCELPPFPANGKWSIIGPHVGLPGELIIRNTVIEYKCNPHYKLSTTSLFVCNTNWIHSNFPICERKCSPKYSTSTTKIKCNDKYGQEVPCDEAVDGTFLKYSCIPYYETPFGYKKLAICQDGTWNFPNPVCQPICGKQIDRNTTTLVHRGSIPDKREYPWIVAIFQKSVGELPICGGSIISQNIIITAAHCVTIDYKNELSPEDFVAAAGKYYSKFQDPRDGNVQYVDVDRFIIHPRYTGAAKRFLADVALLITKDLIIFNGVVQPICYQDLPTIYIYPGQSGVVPGWGIIETGKQPDELRTLQIPYKYEGTCTRELPKEWADKFYTDEKICTGLFNQSRSLCPGDSGSGLYYLNPENNRYYIHGIVSVGPAIEGQCDPQQNSLYTKVVSYYDFIEKTVTKESVEQCELPNFPENGKWSIAKRNKKPGDIVPSNTVLNIECDQNYTLSTSSNVIDCKAARILPKCNLLCPKPKFPDEIIYKCTSNTGIEVNCSYAIDGTILTYSCPGYTHASNGTNTHICKNGSWGHMQVCLVNKTKINEKYVICDYIDSYLYDTTFNLSLCTHVILNMFKPYSEDEEDLPKIVTSLKTRNKNLKVLLGYVRRGGSSILSKVPDDKKERKSNDILFVYNTLGILEDYHFDGINFFWEYTDDSDKMYYIDLLRDLKRNFNKKGFTVTAIIDPYSNDTGYYAEELARILDFVIVRTVDFYSPESLYTGHNSPLYPSSKESDWEKSHLNIHSAVSNLINMGFPKLKIVLSIQFSSRIVFLEDKEEHGVHAPLRSNRSTSEVLFYNQVCTNKNWTTVWDDEQKSVYSYFEDIWIGHENKKSVRVKATYIKDNGFLGIYILSLYGDDNTGICGPKHILLNEINTVLRDNIISDD